MSENNAKIRALATHFKVSEETISCEYNDTYSCETEPGEYLVLTEVEANDAWEESLDSYLDECVMPELPELAQRYFDRDAWKRDAKHDGRGHSLSGYDGDEHEVKIDGEWYFIYRTN